MKKPRVAVVGPFPPTTGGVTTFMLNLMSSLLATEFDFRAYSTSRPVKKNVIDNYGYSAFLRGGVVRAIHGIVLTAWRITAFPFFLVFRRIDIVQVQASDYLAFWEAVLYVHLAKSMGCAALMRIGGHFDHFYDASSPRMKRRIGKALRAADCLIVQSQFTRTFVEKVVQVPNILVLPNWSKHKLRPRKNGEGGAPTILFLANMEAIRKGVEEVIAAMQRLDEEGVAAKFHLYALAPQLIDRIARMNLSNVAAMEGPIEHEQLLDLMHGIDIFLLPSHGEGFPNSLIEAMAAGMASVTTPIAGIPEIVSDGGAILVPVRDSVALTDAIRRLVLDAELRNRLGLEARRTIESRYVPEAALPPLGETYWKLYEARHKHGARNAEAKKPSVLISAPSLDSRVNVSGISAVVLELMAALRNQVSYKHLSVGSPQGGSFLYRYGFSFWQTLGAVFKIPFSRTRIFHSNTALERKSIFRDGVLILVAKASGKRVLLHVHGGRHLQHPSNDATGLAVRMLMRAADVVVFLSETERNTFLETHPAIAHKATSIYNSVSVNLDGLKPPRSPEKGLTVLFSGRLVPEKGIDILLAVARAPFDFPIRFVVYGDGPLRDRVEAEAQANPRLSYAGVYDRSTWTRIFDECDVLLLPSLIGEGMPMVILEAMSFGVIPIATSIASIPEILGYGERGIVVPPGDVGAVVEALRKTQADPVWRVKVQNAARDFAIERFDTRRNALRFAAIYRGLSGSKGKEALAQILVSEPVDNG
jgi:glycosyltransferase involved in cell wall biosynthesis